MLILPSSRYQKKIIRFSLNYTSGTTGNPKGVVYSHRGAALNAAGNGTVTWDGISKRLPLDITRFFIAMVGHMDGQWSQLVELKYV